jgi:hypothetical protein
VVLITSGDTITHVGDVSAQKQENRCPNKVGYKWDYWGVFWIDLWTYGGTYCVYEGKGYQPIPPAEAARLLGRSENELSRPFLYRVPLGWLILGPLAVLGLLGAALERGGGTRVTLPFDDARYQKAFGVLNEQYAKQPAAAEPGQGAGAQAATDDEGRFRAAFEAAVQNLVGAGVPREAAERNLAAMIHVLTQAQPQGADAPARGGPA